jgi:thiol-disulfide isomerase/thioredoxin
MNIFKRYKLTMRGILLLTVLLSLLSCNETKKEVVTENLSDAAQKTVVAKNVAVGQGEIPIYTFDEFEPMLHINDQKTYVVNFWATWCKPCIKEMPYFEELAQNYKDKDVEVLFVSLDFPRLLEKQVIPFVKENNIQSKVVLLDDTGANEWIDKVSAEWSGAIPATVIYNSKKRNFYERTFDYSTLEKALLEVLKP